MQIWQLWLCFAYVCVWFLFFLSMAPDEKNPAKAGDWNQDLPRGISLATAQGPFY